MQLLRVEDSNDNYDEKLNKLQFQLLSIHPIILSTHKLGNLVTND